MPTRSEKSEKVLSIVERFVKDQFIEGIEDIYQSDRVIMNAYEFIDDLVVAAGCLPDEEDEE